MRIIRICLIRQNAYPKCQPVTCTFKNVAKVILPLNMLPSNMEKCVLPSFYSSSVQKISTDFPESIFFHMGSRHGSSKGSTTLNPVLLTLVGAVQLIFSISLFIDLTRAAVLNQLREF